MKSGKHKIMLISVIVAVVALIGLCVIYFRLRHSVVLKPSSEYAVSEMAVLYRQDNASWTQNPLGDSGYTMKSSGCLVSCIASAMTMGGESIDPGELNQLFSDNGVYDPEGNIQWENIRAIDGFHAEVFTDVSGKDVEDCLSAGRYPIVRVRVKGLGNFHYVLIAGTEDGEYICIDPLKDELSKLSDYGGRVYAVRCVWYVMGQG